MSTTPKNNFTEEQILITEELKSEKEAEEVKLFFKEIEEKGNEIYEKQLQQKNKNENKNRFVI
jgi:hypothetical protein